MKKKEELKVQPDNEQMKVWASQGYANMIDDFWDGEITYNVHHRHLKEINNIKAGDLVLTSEGQTGLVTEKVSRDLQGFDVYKIMISGKEFLYSTLELAVIRK